MIHRVLHFLLFVIIFHLGCGNIPETRYFLIDYPLPLSETRAAKYPFVLGVEEFTADALYEEDRIVYRESPYEARYYNYCRWVAPPKKIVTEKVLQQLSSSGLFQYVVPYPEYREVNYVLRGHVKYFEEWDEEETWYARVGLMLEVMDVEKNTLIWHGQKFKQTKAAKRTPREVVKVMGEALRDCIDEFIQELDRQLSDYKGKP